MERKGVKRPRRAFETYSITTTWRVGEGMQLQISVKRKVETTIAERHDTAISCLSLRLLLRITKVIQFLLKRKYITMKLAFQGQNNGNGKLTLTADNLKTACHELGIPDDPHTLRRTARAFDLYYSEKVEQVSDNTFKVASQNGRQEEPYQVLIKPTKHLQAGAYAYCSCEDWMNYSGDQDLPDVNFWCKHSIAALVWLHNNNGNGKRIVNECGSTEAKELQNKLNAQSDSQKNNGNGAKAPSQPMKLDIADPFQEAEALDIDQIEGRKNGELAWKLRNGEYCISYRGIMTLAEKHSIDFDEVSVDGNTVIAKAKNGNERISGKPIYDNANTAIELAKRNAARQLIPLPEIKAIEHKAKLNAEFNWQKAKAKCVELVGEANVGIIIHDLTQAGKLRADNPSHYDRTEWLIIYDACQKDAQVERDPKSVNRWSYNSVEFLDQCQEAIAKVRESKQAVEANEQPLENGNGKRKVQMDKKLRTWLVEADGTKKEISCREICETFESKQNPSIVTRLRAGIDSGADISTVELN
jgi:hypothetical protein